MPLRRALSVSLLLALLTSGCGSAASAPTPPAPAPVPTNFINMAGNWSGSMKSSNYAERSVSMTVVQGSNCVDGVWSGSPSEWTGAISGLTNETSYGGQISIELTVDSGEKCRGVADVIAPVGANELQWTVATFKVVGSCSGSLPRDVVLNLRR